MATQYLVLQDSALTAQQTIARRRMGFEVEDWEGVYVQPFRTKEPFEIIHHPSTSFSAIVIPDKIPLGMRYGEDWTRGKSREYNAETITGRPSQDEVIDRIWPTNKPLKTWEEMNADGWFVE